MEGSHPLSGLLLGNKDLSRTLAAQLERLATEAREAWPGVDLPTVDFVRHLAQRLPSDCTTPEQALERLHCSDLFLACACASANATALVHFERRFLCSVPLFVSRIDASVGFADEVAQLVRQKLFVAAEGARAKILDYGGRGPLGGWLRVVTIRTARNLQRATRRFRSLDTVGGAGQLRASAPDPELGYLKRHYAEEFRRAFELTLAALPPQRRNVLRLYYLEQLSSTAIASIYKVSGAAVRLWLKQSRESILNETRRLLGERLGLESSELDSLFGIIQSQFDLSVSRLLKRSG